MVSKADKLFANRLALAVGVALSAACPVPASAQSDGTLELSSINGHNGVMIIGSAVGIHPGFSVSEAGDVNGDGVDDVIVGDNGADPNGSNSGASYVVFGSTTGLTSPLSLSATSSFSGFVINGAMANDNSGVSVSAAGDVNGDGIDDVLIGADSANSSGFRAGTSYVVYGSSTGLPNPFDLSSINGINGFVINGAAANDRSGISVSGAGDVNGDGIDDVIVGAIGANPNGSWSGASYVVFGATGGPTSQVDLSNLDGVNGFVINGMAFEDISGRSVSGAGDVNGDGIDDVIIGAVLADPNGSNSGASYVVFGARSGMANPLDLSSLNGTNGFVINGVETEDYSGCSVSAAGDINGDGIDDVLVGAYGVDNNGGFSGATYVVFGASSGLPGTIELSSINGANGFVINGAAAGDVSGGAVSAAGDVNGDGIDDLIIGAAGADPNGTLSGSIYVVFGSRSGLTSPLNLSSLDGTNGFAINGASEFSGSGNSVSAAGDVNNDGFDDLIIGIRAVNPLGTLDPGPSYVVYGRGSPFFAGGFEASPH